MKTVIVGVGNIGGKIIGSLLKENHNVFIIDKDAKKVDDCINRYDVMGIVGSGADSQVLNQINLENTDYFIACTDRDELNIVCCVLAKKRGAKYTIARVRSPEYYKETEAMRQEFGIDLVFNPEFRTAEEIAKIIKFPSAVNIESFAKGKAIMVEFHIGEGNLLIDRSVSEIMQEIKLDILFGLIERGDSVFIPRGDFVIKEGDELHVIGDEGVIALFTKKFRIFKPSAKVVFIVGGSKIAYYLAKNLIPLGVGVKLLESDKERCKELSQEIPQITVLHGEATDQDLLREEDLQNCDACVALTGTDEKNVLISLYAKQNGVEKVITELNTESIVNMVKTLDLDTIVSTKTAISSYILRFIRSHEVADGEGVTSFYKIKDKVEALEFSVPEDAEYIGVKVKDLKIRKDVLLGGIIRDGEFIRPCGETSINNGDTVLVVTSAKGIVELSQVLKK